MESLIIIFESDSSSWSQYDSSCYPHSVLSLKYFIHSFSLLHSNAPMALFAFDKKRAKMVTGKGNPEKDKERNTNTNDSKEFDFNDNHNENDCDSEDDNCDHSDESPSPSFTSISSHTGLSGALSLALCWHQRIQNNQNNTSASASSSSPSSSSSSSPSPLSRRFRPRILLLLLSVSLSSQSIWLMNSIFSLHQMGGKVDSLVFPPDGSDAIHIQQAVKMTDGIYENLMKQFQKNQIIKNEENQEMKKMGSEAKEKEKGEGEGEEEMERVESDSSFPFSPSPCPPPTPSSHFLSTFFPTLLSLFLPSSALRSHLMFPTVSSVDYRATCFCHRKIVDSAFVCPLCLAVFCKANAKCLVCQTRFHIQAGGGGER